MLLLRSFIFGLSLVLSQLFDFLVQVFFLLSKNFKFRLFAQLDSDVIGKTRVAKLSQFIHNFLAPIYKLFFVIFDLTLVAFYVRVIL
jgi:hypothetical protein